MNLENYIPISNLCLQYQVEYTFFKQINEYDLIEIETFEQVQYISIEKLHDLEKIIRLYHDLDLNEEHLDIIFNLVKRIESLQEELKISQHRLKFFQE